MVVVQPDVARVSLKAEATRFAHHRVDVVGDVEGCPVSLRLGFFQYELLTISRPIASSLTLPSVLVQTIMDVPVRLSADAQLCDRRLS